MRTLTLAFSLCVCSFALAAPNASKLSAPYNAGPAPRLAKTIPTNPDRGYPPGCVGFPLPSTPSGPAQVVDTTLITTPLSRVEPVRFIFWRKPCSGGKSVLFATIQRLQPADLGVLLPLIIANNGSGDAFVRLVREPNTFLATTSSQALSSETYVVDRVFQATVALNLNQSLALRATDGTTTVFNGVVAAYNPSAYAEAALPIPINGYLSGSWYDVAHGGEGIFLEIAENPEGSVFVFYAWFTYDTQGFPYWIIGQASVPQGARTVTVPSLIFQGGGFAGNFNPGSLLNASWGNVTFSFPSCSSMLLQFQSTTTIQGVPSGSGTRSWARLTTINGLACE